MPPPPTAARSRAGVGLGLLAAVGLFLAGVELARRSAGWLRPTPVAPFRVVVPAGDAVVRRGDPVTLSAYLEPAAPDAVLPAVIDLVRRPGPGQPETRLRMAADPGTGAVVAALPPALADFEYRVEAGAAASDWFAVRVADPVELAPGTAVEIAPPAYATGVVKAQTLPGLPDLDAVAGSTAAVRLYFTRPAASAVLEWRPDAPGGLPDTLPVVLDPDAAGGTATVPLREPGGLRLVLTNEPGVRKLRTEVAVRVRVRPDELPRFVTLTGLWNARRAVLPGQVVTVTVGLADDVGVAAAELEIAAGPGFAAVTRLPVALTGAGTRTAEGRVTFDPTALAGVAGTGKDAGILNVRVRATDTRPGAPPATYPGDGWAEWQVTPAAPPPDAQEVLGPLAAVRRSAGTDGLRAAEAALRELSDAARGKGRLPVDDATRLATARAKVKEAATGFRAAAREAELTPHLRPLAAAYRALADATVTEIDEFLRRAATDDPAERRTAVEAAVTRLRQAHERIDHLTRAAREMTRGRLDADRLAALAARYTALADRAAAGAPAVDVAAERARLAVRLAEILADSDGLRRAMADAAGAERGDLADRAAALAAAAHDLDATADRLAADVRAAVGGELAAEQTAVAGRAAAVLGALATPARLTRVTLPDPAAATAAAGLLASGKLAAVLTELEKFAQALDRAADDLDKASLDPSDGKAVARALARWQGDVRERAAGFAAFPAAAVAALRVEQRALRAAAARLDLPPDPALALLREEVGVHLGMAARALDADGAGAEKAMTLAAGALTRLADSTPSAADRLTRSRADLDALRTDHDSAATTAEQLLRPLEQKAPDDAVRRGLTAAAPPVAERYEALAGRLTALDLPGHAARRHVAVAALQTAAADLRAGLPADAAAAVAAARRALDRLLVAVNGQPPADAQLDELARLQAWVAAPLVIHAATQGQVARGLAALPVPEAPALLHDAREAVRRAEAALKDGKEVARHTAVAADVLAALADRAAGRRPDVERVVAFAAARFRAAAAAPGRAGRPREEGSAEEKRQLGREADELRHVRVGAAGQVPKWRALELYTRLRSKSEPDRDAAGQTELAHALAALAAVMTDAVRADPPAEPDPAAGYLPAPRLAAPLRDLAREQRAVRDRATAAEARVADRLRPSDGKAFEELERRQRELAAAAPTVPSAGLAADRLRVGDARTAAEAAGQALAALKGADPALADRQSALLTEIRALTGDTRGAAARQAARARELGRVADDLAAALAGFDGPDADAVHATAELARRAARSFAAAADRTAAADTVGADQSRGEAEAALTRVGPRVRPGAVTGGAGPGRALRAAASAVRADPSPDAFRRAAAALAAAARAIPIPTP